MLGNGDICSAQDAKDKLGNLDGLLVGRGTWGNPWMMKDIQNYFDTGEVLKTELSMIEKIPDIQEHAKLMVKVKGEERGVMEMRKYLLMYVKGFPGAKEMRKDLVMVKTMRDVERVLGKLLPRLRRG